MSLKIEQDGKVLRITLAAQERKNVLDAASSFALLKAVRDAEDAEETGAVLIDAEGPVFCGGFAADADLGLYGLKLAKPLVVAVQGVALNGALALMASAQLAIVAQGSSFGLVEIREGRWNPLLLAAVAGAVGDRRAKELYLTGRIFTAPDAMNWGLAHQMAPAFELDDRAAAVAHALANADAGVVRSVIANKG